MFDLNLSAGYHEMNDVLHKQYNTLQAIAKVHTCLMFFVTTCYLSDFFSQPVSIAIFSLSKTQIQDLNFTVPGLMDMVSSVTIEEGKFQNKYFKSEFSQTSKMKSSQPKKKARVNNRIHI